MKKQNAAKAKVSESSKSNEAQPAATLVQPDGPNFPRLAYRMDETAEVLGLNYWTVQRLVKRGLLRSSSALRVKLIPVTEIDRFLKATL